MLYTGSYRPPTRRRRADFLVVALVWAVSLTVLTVGATIAHLAAPDPRDHRVDLPPSDWNTTPPLWID